MLVSSSFLQSLFEWAGCGLSEGPEEPLPLGPRGEDYARRRLEQQGWTFVTANWHCRSGELDLVMKDGTELVFVEVKTRRGDFSGRAEEGVSAHKARRLLSAGEWFVAEHPELEDLIWRIDLVAITVNCIDEVVRYSHVRNAVLSG
jgi:putative endonuclease